MTNMHKHPTNIAGDWLKDDILISKDLTGLLNVMKISCLDEKTIETVPLSCTCDEPPEICKRSIYFQYIHLVKDTYINISELARAAGREI